jgi:hypothetical protein
LITLRYIWLNIVDDSISRWECSPTNCFENILLAKVSCSFVSTCSSTALDFRCFSWVPLPPSWLPNICGKGSRRSASRLNFIGLWKVEDVFWRPVSSPKWLRCSESLQHLVAKWPALCYYQSPPKDPAPFACRERGIFRLWTLCFLRVAVHSTRKSQFSSGSLNSHWWIAGAWRGTFCFTVCWTYCQLAKLL